MSHRIGRFFGELRRRRVIRTAGWYLGVAFVAMQVVEAVFPYMPLPDPDRAGTIVLGLLAAGFPVAIVCSWILDITPKGLRLDGPGAATEDTLTASVDPRSPVRTDLAPQPGTLAVLPFDNLSDDPENEYFSDGITDDIIMSIAHIQGVRVLSRASVMKYKKLSRSVGEVADELGVGMVVRGSVRRSGSRVRIVAELVDPRTDSHVWSDRYDRGLEDIFEVQSDVAARIATAVERELSLADRMRIQRRGTAVPEAYDLYLKARHLWNQRTEGSVSDSLKYFRGALEIDPTFALAFTGLAEAHVVLAIYGAQAPREASEAARAAAQDALAIDPQLGEAVAARASVQAIYDWKWLDAERGFQHALSLAPSYATARQWYALNVLTPQGRFEEATEELEKASELDPASSSIAVGRGIIAFYARDLHKAAGSFEVVVRSHPSFALGHYFLGQCRTALGEPAKGIEAFEAAARLADDSSETLAALGNAMALDGRHADATDVLRRLGERSSRGYVSPALQAQVLVGLGRHDEALDRLEHAAELRAADLIWLGVRPAYDPLRGELRFQHLLSLLGLAAT